jgi:hypothetical protein
MLCCAMLCYIRYYDAVLYILTLPLSMSCHVNVMSCQCHVNVMSCQCHVNCNVQDLDRSVLALYEDACSMLAVLGLSLGELAIAADMSR